MDGVDVWQRAAFFSTESYSIVVNANLGSTIDFAVEAGPNNNDACDATFFTAFIRTAGPNVVMKIGGDACAHALELNQPSSVIKVN